MKTMEEIYQELAAEFQSRTNLSAGGSGDLAVRFYAVAAQLYGLYAQADWTTRQCFPQTAQGEALDLHAQLRGVERKTAQKAVGKVRFFAAADRAEEARIQAGTVCMTAEGVRFLTVESGTIALGETELDLVVEAAEAGAQGNVEAGRIMFLALPPAGVTACTNPDAMAGGCGAEEDEALRERVMTTYRRLANGANTAFYEQTAMAYDGVAAVKVLPRNRGISTVDIVVAARSGMPDQTLLDGLGCHFEQMREIAVDVQVLSPVSAPVDVAIELSVKQGYSFDEVSQTVRAAVEGLFTGELLGRPVLQAELTALTFLSEGVSNCTVTVSCDTAVEDTTLPCLSSLDITEK